MATTLIATDTRMRYQAVARQRQLRAFSLGASIASIRKCSLGMQAAMFEAWRLTTAHRFQLGFFLQCHLKLRNTENEFGNSSPQPPPLSRMHWMNVNCVRVSLFWWLCMDRRMGASRSRLGSDQEVGAHTHTTILTKPQNEPLDIGWGQEHK